MTGKEFGLRTLSRLLEFDAFKVTPSNLILYEENRKLLIPIRLLKFSLRGIPANEKIHAER